MQAANFVVMVSLNCALLASVTCSQTESGAPAYVPAGTINSDICQPQWLATFGQSPTLNQRVNALAVFDDGLGGGPTLYAGGRFTTASGSAANRIAKWDSELNRWMPLASGMDAEIHSLVVFDDGLGAGPALYAGGQFTVAGDSVVNHIAKWNPEKEQWSALSSGVSGTVWALEVYNNGSGTALYAGGAFQEAGGSAANFIARWDGEHWSPVGGGVNSSVRALVAHDYGDGEALYVGGGFTTAGEISARRIARWEGSADRWSALGTGANGTIGALAAYDDGTGSGPAIYAGGWFTEAGGAPANHIAKLDPTSQQWYALESGVNGVVRALTVIEDDEAKLSLYAGGDFRTAGDTPARFVARWDGGQWSSLAEGMNLWVYALTSFDDRSGAGPSLVAGGQFTTAGGSAINRVAKWNASAEHWLPLGIALNGSVTALTTFDDGSGDGPTLYVGGSFTVAGGKQVNRIARWNHRSGQWESLGNGMNDAVYGLAIHDDGLGGGPALYASGRFTEAGGVTVNHIARWNASTEQWKRLGTGVDGNIWPGTWAGAMASFDDGSGNGPALFLAGAFETAGGVPAPFLARWDGTQWSTVGGGVDHLVRALIVHDDGTGLGPALYAGGQFSTAGGFDIPFLGRWDGAQWSRVSTGVTGIVGAMASQDSGIKEHARLFVAGSFPEAGGFGIAQWDGVQWSAVGGGLNAWISTLQVLDNGSGAGPTLFAGGSFTSADGANAESIAKWDGAQWTGLDSAMAHGVRAICVVEQSDSEGPMLLAGGQYSSSVSGDSFLARWQGCRNAQPSIPGDLNSDGVVDVSDLLILLAAWGPCPGSSACPADFNSDGVIDVSDLLILLANWG